MVDYNVASPDQGPPAPGLMDTLSTPEKVYAGFAAFGAVGAYEKAVADRANIEFGARVMEKNAELARMEGDYAYQAGKTAEFEIMGELHNLAATQRAAQAGNGLSLASGSFQDVQAATYQRARLEAGAAAHRGALAQWRKDTEAAMLDVQAEINRKAKPDVGLSVLSSLVGSAGNYAAAQAARPVR